MDAKSRVAIPAMFRKVLAEGSPEGAPARAVINYGDHLKGFCRCYSEASFEALEDAIRAMPLGHPTRKRLEKHVLLRSVTATIDDTGRIVVPPKVKAKAGLPDREPDSIYFGGMGDHFELWREASHDESEGDADDLSGLPDDVDFLSLIGNPDAVTWG